MPGTAARIAAETARLEQEANLRDERHEAITGNLGEIMTIVSESREQCARKADLCNQRHEEKLARREEKDGKQRELVDLVHSILADREQEKQRLEEERAIAAEKPGTVMLHNVLFTCFC